jgi:hypothetical protein
MSEVSKSFTTVRCYRPTDIRSFKNCVCVVGVSLWTLKSTGCGLPPGPLGLFGAAEGKLTLPLTPLSLRTRTRSLTLNAQLSTINPHSST